MNESDAIFSVSELSQALKNAVEKTFPNVRVRGELSGITRAASGHIYLSLKDADSVINAIIWRSTPCGFKLEEGLEIIAGGKLTTYPARSNYQLIISDMEIAGAGAILKMLEERKQKLAAEGLFDSARKKRPPEFPRVIGIVTSPTGAALQDILNKLRDRLPVRVVLYPAQVQGAAAAAEVAAGIKYFNNLDADATQRPDVIIVARGGGALEDLLPFSEEIVVRAVAASGIPIISGVGHEPDWMLIDFAADVRAPTPTGAAEIVVPTKASLTDELAKMGAAMKSNFTARINLAAQRLDDMRIKSPAQMIADHRARLADAAHLMAVNWKNYISQIARQVAHLGQMLESMSYKNVLRRGFAIVRRGQIIISSKDDFATPATIEFADGTAAV